MCPAYKYSKDKNGAETEEWPPMTGLQTGACLTVLWQAPPSSWLKRMQRSTAKHSRSSSRRVENIFLTKAQLLNFTNGDPGSGCWDESLLVQRGRESTQPTYPADIPDTMALSGKKKKTKKQTNKQKLLQAEYLSLLLPVHHSILPPDSSYSLCFFSFSSNYLIYFTSQP